MQRPAVFGVEAAPEENVVLADGDLTVVDKGLADSIELVVVIDHVGLVLHVALGGILSQFDQHFLRMFPCGSGANILIAKLGAELIPVVVEEPVQGSPNVTLLLVDILDYSLYLLPVGESVFVSQLVVFLQEFLDRLADLTQEVRGEFGADGWHGGNAKCWSMCHCVAWWKWR